MTGLESRKLVTRHQVIEVLALEALSRQMYFVTVWFQQLMEFSPLDLRFQEFRVQSISMQEHKENNTLFIQV